MPAPKIELPEYIKLPCGTILNKRISCIKGLGMSEEDLKQLIKSKNGKYRVVDVLHRNLRGKNDLHGRPYQPNRWILTNVDIDHKQPCLTTTNTKKEMAGGFNGIRPGDKVTYLDSNGNARTGVARIVADTHVTVNAGGRYGTPVVVTLATLASHKFKRTKDHGKKNQG